MTPAQDKVCQQLSASYQELGLSRSVSRVYAYLILCEPAAQTAAELQDVLGLSAGAVSEAVSTLTDLCLIVRSKKQGTRQYYYEVVSDSWQRSFVQQLTALDHMITATKTSMELFPGNNRLASMLDLYEYVAHETREMLERYRQNSV